MYQLIIRQFAGNEQTQQVGISDIREHLPITIEQNNQRSVAQYVVDEIGRIEGLRFWYKRTSNLREKPRNFPSSFSYATTLTFFCSQRKVCVLRCGDFRNTESCGYCDESVSCSCDGAAAGTCGTRFEG